MTEPLVSPDRGKAALLTLSEPTERRERLRALLPLVTPGPWRWFGHTSGSIILATVHDGICTVAGAARKGMQGAQFTFFDRPPATPRGWNGRYKTATELAVQECHYRDDIVDMDNAQARWLAAADPQTVGELFADHDRLQTENDRLRHQLSLLAPIANEALKPTGEHRLIDGYCPDCGGSCLIGFGVPGHPYTCGRCRESMGIFMAPEFVTAEGYQDHVRRVHPEGDTRL